MPTSLQLLVRARQPGREEENLQQGRVWVYAPGTMYTNFCSGFCWKAPGSGTAEIEIWGAGGSGAEMCCCGFGLPGNAGAYSKKTITVDSSSRVYGSIGFSCGNADDLCFRGCSDSTGLCWIGSTGNGCMCASGGKGGVSYCSTTPSAFCCFGGNGFCRTGPYNDNCGLVCNYCPGAWIACAYGGDINCCGQFSCVSFFGCSPNCTCCTQYHVAVPAGYFSCGSGAVATHGTENDASQSAWSGQGLNQGMNAVAAVGRGPVQGSPLSYCWRGDRSCGCYNMQGCTIHVAPGVGGYAPSPCGDVRDHGGRGGQGAVRIRFY